MASGQAIARRLKQSALNHLLKAVANAHLGKFVDAGIGKNTVGKEDKYNTGLGVSPGKGTGESGVPEA